MAQLWLAIMRFSCMKETDTGCPPRPSGNTPVAAALRRTVHSFLRQLHRLFLRARQTLIAPFHMVAARQEIPFSDQCLSVGTNQMASVCMTCTAMCGNGARIVMRQIITRRAHGVTLMD